METQELKDILERMVRERDAVKRGLEVVTAIQELEQAEKDLKNRIESLKSENNTLTINLGGIKDVIKKAGQEAKETIEEAKDEADRLIFAADARAKEIVSGANKECDKIADEIVSLKKAKDRDFIEQGELAAAVSILKAELAALEGIKDRARKALGV